MRMPAMPKILEKVRRTTTSLRRVASGMADGTSAKWI